jgi:phosphoglycolate phosphatase
MPYFALVVGSNLDHTRTAKAEVIAHILAARPALRRRRPVMIGDREHDVLGARQHGLDSIAVGHGFGSPAELRAARPTHLVPSVAALAALLGVPG